MRFAFFLLPALAIAGDFTTSLGDTYPYLISAITTDSAGNTYVVGSRALSSQYGILISGYFYPTTDVFVSKLDPNGNLLFTDTFAGKGADAGSAIALDPSGNIYIAGGTTSDDFPVSRALQGQPSVYGSTGFIIKLTNDGSTILYSTYFGGTQGGSSITSLATDAKGNLYLTGSTTSLDFPHTAGMPFGPPAPQQANVMLTAISASGDEILFSGVLPGFPGSGQGGTVGVGVDAAGSAYFVGNSENDGFLAKVNAGSTSLSYQKSLPDIATAMAVDPAGNVYVAEIGLLSHTGKGSLLKLNPADGTVVWTNNLGGDAAVAQSIAVDAGGNLWATGTALSSSFPNSQGWSTGTAFVVGLNAAGSQTTFSALYPAGTVEQSIALDPSGLVHLAGMNGFVSAIAPQSAPSMKIFDFGNAFGGAATARIAPGEVISIYGPGIGPATAASATPSNGFFPTTFNGVQVEINGMNMPLLYVSANQINAVVPMEVATGVGATVRVINGAAVSPAYPVWIVASAPQAFPTVLNQDGTINSYSNRAKFNSIVTFYATGWQSSFYPLADGQVAAIANDACLGECQVSVQTGRFPWIGTVLYGGAAPGIVAGVTQFNISVGLSPGILSGPYTFHLTGPSTTLSLGIWINP